MSFFLMVWNIVNNIGIICSLGDRNSFVNPLVPSALFNGKALKTHNFGSCNWLTQGLVSGLEQPQLSFPFPPYGKLNGNALSTSRLKTPAGC